MPDTDTHHSQAAKAEAEGVDTATIKWRNHEFTVPSSPDDWDVDVTEAFEEGKAATAVRLMLGKKQWDGFKATKPKNRDLADLFDHIARALGFEGAGE